MDRLQYLFSVFQWNFLNLKLIRRLASIRASYTALYVYILVKLFVNYNWSLINHFPLFWIKRCVNRGKITYRYIRAILKNILRMTDTWFSKLKFIYVLKVFPMKLPLNFPKGKPFLQIYIIPMPVITTLFLFIKSNIKL